MDSMCLFVILFGYDMFYIIVLYAADRTTITRRGDAVVTDAAFLFVAGHADEE